MPNPFFTIALALLAGCTTTIPGNAALPADSQWRFVTIDGAPPVPPDKATLTLQADRLSASAGCNGMGASWETRDGRLIMNSPLISTQMFCEGRMEQERAIGALLSAQPTVTLEGDRLLLRSSDHAAQLRRAR